MFRSDLLEMHCVESDNQRNLFTPYHKRWDVYLIYGDKNDLKVEMFNYQCNKNEEPQLNRVLESLVLDAITYIDATDILDFAHDLGMDLTDRKQIEEVRAMYKECGEETEKLKHLFGDGILDDDLLMDLDDFWH